MVFLKYVATIGFIGYLPFAPGTFGSLAAFILFILLQPSPLAHIIFLGIIIPLGVISSHYAEKTFETKDSRHIVIDEFCGYFLSVVFLPFTYAIPAFFLFRFFDILKPFPIRKMESVLSGGIGVMADDILAAMYTNLILQLIKTLKQII